MLQVAQGIEKMYLKPLKGQTEPWLLSAFETQGLPKGVKILMYTCRHLTVDKKNNTGNNEPV